MNNSNPYQFLTQGLLYFVLVCQLWTSSFSYCVLLFDTEIEFVDFMPGEERESEEEKSESEEKVEEKSDEYIEDAFSMMHNNAVTNLSPKYQMGFYWCEFHEVYTPPPKSNRLLA